MILCHINNVTFSLELLSATVFFLECFLSRLYLPAALAATPRNISQQQIRNPMSTPRQTRKRRAELRMLILRLSPPAVYGVVLPRRFLFSLHLRPLHNTFLAVDDVDALTDVLAFSRSAGFLPFQCIDRSSGVAVAVALPPSRKAYSKARFSSAFAPLLKIFLQKV